FLYDKCGVHFADLIVEAESQDYGACTFKLNGFKVAFRISKITPTKTGQFVSIWKRSQEGLTQPFEWSDDIDFVIVSSRQGDNFGQFIFPKRLLLQKGIMTGPDKQGKRGIRVYPPWDTVANKQAAATQGWQTKYFLTIHKSGPTSLDLVRLLDGAVY
ncbi:MAG: hypothetical protein EOP48_09925, partial [Sphingobacteriales bacterium]